MEKDLKSVYSEILKTNGIDKEILEIEISEPDEIKGEHFGSKCAYVKVIFNDPAEVSLHLFVKEPIKMPNAAHTDRFVKVMVKEGTFLTEIVNRLNQFSQEHAGDAMMDGMFPKMLYAGSDRIVMENLTFRGYQMIDKLVGQDLNQAKLVLTTLAKLHSVSYGLVQECGGVIALLEKFPELTEVVFHDETKAIMAEMFEGTFILLQKIIQTSNVDGKAEAVKFLEPYCGLVMKKMQQNLEKESILLCINHGDCWNNNMMFSKQLDQVTLLDLQVNRIASPCSDIGYFLFSSVKLEVLEQWKQLLEFYYEQFKIISLALGQPVKFSFEELLKDFALKCEFGFLFSLFFSMAGLGMKNQEAGSEIFETGHFEGIITAYIEQNQEKVSELVQRVIKMINIFHEIQTFC